MEKYSFEGAQDQFPVNNDAPSELAAAPPSKGVNNFLILRSITDTALKNKQPVLNALNLIAKFEGTD